MSGALASMIDGIYMVGILTSKGEVSLYVDGKRVLHEEMGL